MPNPKQRPFRSLVTSVHALPAVAFALYLFLALPMPGRAAEGVVYTPERGNPVRSAVLDTIRTEVESWVEHDIVFYNVSMRVLDDWAWTTVEPRTPDGASSYEPINVLLHMEDGHWVMIDTPNCAGDEEECFDDTLFFNRVMGQHPEAPQALFPVE